MKKIIKKHQNVKIKKLTKKANEVVQIFVKLLSHVLI